ncbi:MAG: hypothetical protein J0I57_06545, partial [Hyphomicrobium sp.]|nr:hypothetical protein [Hyphomicrobium sp.]
VRLCLSPRSPSMTAYLKTVDPEYVSPFLGKTPKEISFKETLTPYIAILQDIDDRRLPIRKIIVGPHADKERRRERLTKYLELKGLAIEVRCSETPFV